MNRVANVTLTSRFARQAVFLGATVALALSASACSAAAPKANDDAVVAPHACASAQWTFGKPLPVGDGPYIYVPIQVQYRSGPRCQLRVVLNARLTGAGGHLINGGVATGVLTAVIGPAPGERETSLMSVPLDSFLWSNWCLPAGGTIRAVVRGSGHVYTTVVQQRPMCLDPHRSIGFTWGVK